MSGYTRECPQCGQNIAHTAKHNRDAAVRSGATCKPCMYANNKKRFGGLGNPFYGKSHNEETRSKMAERRIEWWSKPHSEEHERLLSNLEKGRGPQRSTEEAWIEKYGEEIAREKLKEHYKRLSNPGAANGNFGKSPSIQAGNGWSGWYRGWFFRSVGELNFMLQFIEEYDLNWRSAEDPEWIIYWYDSKGSTRTYRADFIIEDFLMVECKPYKLWFTDDTIRKANAAERFCDDHGMQYKLIDPGKPNKELMQYLYESGMLEWLPRYEEKWHELFTE